MKATLLTAAFGLYLVLFAIYLVACTAYFILGERMLRRFRSRYPHEWHMRGKPTFVSFAILGPRWWRPLAAGNFFTYKEYRELGDAELTQRGDVVRVLQVITNGSSTAWLVLAFVALVFLRP